MGIDNIDILKDDPNPIRDMANYIKSRKAKGMSAAQIRADLRTHHYDEYSITAFLMLHYASDDD